MYRMTTSKQDKQWELNCSKNVLAAGLSGIEDSVIAADNNLNISYVNPAAENLFEISAEEVMGKSLESICSFHDRKSGKPTVIGYKELLKDGTTRKLPEVVALTTFKKREIPVSGFFAGIRDDKDHPEGVVMVLRNQRESEESYGARVHFLISELLSLHMMELKTRETLQTRKNRFRALVEKSPDVVAVLSPDGIIQFMSPSVKKVLGYDADELTAINAFSMIHQDDLPGVDEKFRRIIEESVEGLVAEYRFLHKSGYWVYLESVGSDLTNDPNINGVVVYSRDISDRINAEQELVSAKNAAEEMNRVKSTLLANMSHEMRTPLTGILGFAGILASELSDSEAKEMAVRIQLSGRRLLETIESVLDLAKLESEKVDIQLENVNLVDEVARAMEVHTRSARQKGLTFNVRTELKECYMDIDRQLFSRIMYNLLSNAFKYTDHGGVTIHISRIELNGQSVAQVDVKDTGVGISPHFLPQVFDEFQQESTGLARKFEGTGLGMAITRKLVDIMGGRISVSSKKGKGTTFTIQLPVHEQTADSDSYDAEGGTESGFNNMPRILIAEDDFDSSLIARYYLGNDYHVETVDSGEKALEWLKNKPFDLVILDISLGAGIDGITTLKSIRSNHQWKTLPVIALTARVLGGDAGYYLAEGFSGYLAKPFKKSELLHLVSLLLKQSKEK